MNIYTQTEVVRSDHLFSSKEGKAKKWKISRYPPSSNDKYDRNTHSSTGWHRYDVHVTAQIDETVHSGNDSSTSTDLLNNDSIQVWYARGFVCGSINRSAVSRGYTTRLGKHCKNLYRFRQKATMTKRSKTCLQPQQTSRAVGGSLQLLMIVFALLIIGQTQLP